MSPLVTSLLMHLPNLYLSLTSFTYVTRFMLFLTHHLKGYIEVYLGSSFISFMLLQFCPYISVCIYIYIYINFLNNNISQFHDKENPMKADIRSRLVGTCIHGWAMSHPYI